jgi:hypothetical protein
VAARALPTIWAIQRTNAILVLVTALILWHFLSTASALASVLGGAVVIANLFILSVMGRLMLAAAGTGSRMAKVGVLAIPLKLLLVAALVYLLLSRAHVDGIGFGAGVLTQSLAAFIETGRVAFRAAG